VEKHVLGKIPSPNLRAYVVWVPVLRKQGVEESARGVADEIPDPRATQFVDTDGAFSKAYARVIHLPTYIPAWDVYFVFGPDVRWQEGQGSGQPPAPNYWMHQLGRAAPPELLLNADQLAAHVSRLLSELR
jgi:hypothetical protein